VLSNSIVAGEDEPVTLLLCVGVGLTELALCADWRRVPRLAPMTGGYALRCVAGVDVG
jgi:hypothetical protein